MSTYAYTKLYLFHEDKDGTESIIKKIDINVNYMKNLLFGSDWVDELEGYEANIPSQFDIELDYEAIGYIDPKMIKQMKEDTKDSYIINEDDCRLFVNGFADMYVMSDKYNFKQEVDNSEALVWKKVYRKNGNYSQIWITEEILSNAAEKYSNELYDKYKTLFEKEQLTKSLEYYKLSDDQKSNILEDISYLKDDIEEYKTKIQSCYQMIGLMDGFKEDNKEDFTDRLECCLYLC